jgi:hypothetical protein
MSRKRRLSQQDLRAAGVTPGRVITRYVPDGERAQIRQLTPEGPERRRDFIRRLTSTDEVNEASEGSR